MTEAQDTIRQMLKDWDAATDEQRAAALAGASAAVGSVEDTAHYLLGKVEWAIETDQIELARQHMREAIKAYTSISDPAAYALAAERQAHIAEKLNDLWGES